MATEAVVETVDVAVGAKKILFTMTPLVNALGGRAVRTK